MKQTVITCLLVFFLTSVFGQNIIEKHFSTYKGQDNFTSIHVTSKTFELAAYLDFEDADEEFEEFKEFLSTVKSFDMIAGREVDNASKKYQSALKKVQSTHDELMTVSEKEGNFTFLIDESNGIVKELVMVGSQEGNLAIFSLTGNMELSKLSKMTNMMNADGGTGLKKMFDNGLHEIKVYPNPIEKGGDITIEVPDDMTSGTVSILNLNGSKIKTFEINSARQSIQTSGLAAGNYILEFKNDQVSIKRKVIIQ